MVNKETFKNVGTNAEISAGNYEVYQDVINAEHHDNLPHNAFVLANRNTSCTLFVFLDNYSDVDKPDYILFPSQQLTVPMEDGVHFHTMFVKNTHATTAVSANEIKYRISTVKEV